MSEITEMTAPSIAALFNTTKGERESFANQLIDHVLQGRKNPIEVNIQLKCMEDIIGRVLGNKFFKEALVEEASKYGKAPAEFHNATIQVKEAGTKWDYSNTGDHVLDTLAEQRAELDKKIKARQAFLQTIPETGVADPETGAMLSAATKTSSTIVATTLK